MKLLYSQYYVLCLVFFTILVSFTTNVATGQIAQRQDINDLRYRFQPRVGSGNQVDRQEGLQEIPVAGEALALVAALLNAKSIPSGRLSPTYRLGFFLPQAEREVFLQVRDYNFFNGRYHYRMLPTPASKAYGSGFQQFPWDATLSRDLGLNIKDIGAVAILGKHGHNMIAPVLLHDAPFPGRILIEGCHFVFVPNATMEVDARLFLKGETHRSILERLGEKWYKGISQTLTWNGKDSQGSPSSGSLYILRLKAYLPVPGKPPEQLVVDYEFYYTPEIIYQP